MIADNSIVPLPYTSLIARDLTIGLNVAKVYFSQFFAIK